MNATKHFANNLIALMANLVNAWPTAIAFSFILAMQVSSSTLYAQSQSDEAAIRQVIEDYVVGWRTADTVLLSKAFDLEAGVVLWVDRKAIPELLKSMKLKELINRNAPNVTFGIGYTIEDLKVVNSQLAIAMVKTPINKSYYIDCLELQKINNTWKIVLKSFVYFPSE